MFLFSDDEVIYFMFHLQLYINKGYKLLPV